VTDLPLTWAVSSHARRVASVALLPLLGAVLLGQPGLLALAAPAAAALALGARRPRYGARALARVSAERCFEGEELAITVEAELAGEARRPGGDPAAGGGELAGMAAVASLSARLVPGRAFEAGAGPHVHVVAGERVIAQWRVRALRWGRWQPGRVELAARSRGGLFTGRAVIALPAVAVFPRPPALSRLVLPARLRDRIGDHADRRPGDGVEFAGVRQFAPGDRLRRVNWPVTTRRGALHVNELAGERAAEVVAVIDAFSDAGLPGESSLDRAVRGAAGLARAYTRAGDRFGLITLGGPLRWVTPGCGRWQFYQIAESVIDVRGWHSYVSPDLARVPRAALPPGALVVMFTPLLDDRAIAAAADLRERGHPVIVVDVLAAEPVPPPRSRAGELALRAWRLERRALRYRLESLGIPVTGWPGRPAEAEATVGAPEASLDPGLAQFTRRRVGGGAR